MSVSGPQTKSAGDTATYTVTTSGINGFGGTVALSATGVPAGMNATFGTTVNGVTPLTVTTMPGTSPGTSPKSNTASLTIQGAPDFTITAYPSTVKSIPNGAVSLNVSVSGAQGFGGTVTITPSGLPTGAVANPTSQTITGSGAASFVITTVNSPLATSTIKLQAVTATATRQTSAQLSIGPPAAATMIAPAPNSILTSSQSVFTWTTSPGATLYQLNLGTAPGTSNISSVSTGATQLRVSNLPAEGSTVYATLSTQISGTWQPPMTYLFPRGPGRTPARMYKEYPPQDSQNSEFLPAVNDPLINNNTEMISGPWAGWSGSTVLPTSSTSSCVMEGGLLARLSPSINSTNYIAFDMNFTVPSSIAAGTKSVTCLVAGVLFTYPQAVFVYDGTPVISSVDQDPPEVPNGYLPCGWIPADLRPLRRLQGPNAIQAVGAACHKTEN